MNRNNIFTLVKRPLAAALIGLLLILVSCHREEIPVTENCYTIEFSGISGWIDTRTDNNQASSLPSDFTNFRVWAQNGSNTSVFGSDGTAVSTTDGGQTWTYSPVRYWQAGTYNFYAVFPEDFATGSLANGALNLSFGNGWNLSSQTDLMLATAPNISGRFNTDDKPEPVGLTFSHLLSKIGFSVKDNDNDNVTIKVTSISISGNHKTASGYSTTGGWSWKSDDTATSQTLPLANSNGVTIGTTDYTAVTSSNGVMVFPETCSLKVSVQYMATMGVSSATINASVTIPVNLMAGNNYVYKLLISSTGITISSSIQPWDTIDNITNDFQ